MKNNIDLSELIDAERAMQNRSLMLVPSENIPSSAVRKAMISPLINRYSEGYPGKRYYMGQEHIDSLERRCIELAKLTFGADAYDVNVQSLSGSIANLSIYLATLPLKSKILAMQLASGGHLSHGSKASFTGSFFKFSHYTLNENEEIDFNQVRSIARAEKPDMIVCGASAYPKEIDFAAFRGIADEVGALLLADISHISGLIIAGEHVTPFGLADIVMTTTHKTLRGPKGSLIFFKDSLTIDKTVFPGLQGGINLSAMAGIAVALQESLSDKYRDCMRETKKSAAALAKQLMNAGLKLVCNGSENHLMIVKLEEGSAREITSRLQNVGIMTNPNSLSTDKSPFKNSGVRLGTPVLCTRGMKEEDMSAVSDFFLRGLHLSETAIFSEKHRTLKNEIATFLEGFSEIIEI